ncbi:hypothetical protein [Lentilactobacillus parabuchneri]|uniref:hypothetical protein n=1 Tax=Lentilactobacillus parabuchneri TaxID=152331 RepID=UPI000A0FE8DF|nr:hypothetical protein [Lentilactobacillus parabuchneri]ORN12266.1 hypothetical protein FAM23164_02736 [Lentilactobacillus parabuchneri]ORN14493.1 hypothetical protein FAM23165_02664 [Lentilactobacillus parabuchneri]ORN16380.1 hypothetical protein FAM23166_02737 [Lentilactobacillus parabuchneri]ORN19674.1 hypothetical protein FAM23167_02709 [Lentilactobacillus parabuchneri]
MDLVEELVNVVGKKNVITNKVDCKINPTLFGQKRSAPKNGFVINTILKEAGLFCPNTGQTILGPMIFGVDR